MDRRAETSVGIFELLEIGIDPGSSFLAWTGRAGRRSIRRLGARRPRSTSIGPTPSFILRSGCRGGPGIRFAPAPDIVTAASLALHGDGTHKVSLDHVIATMRQTGADMSAKYKETSQGGLAVNFEERQ